MNWYSTLTIHQKINAKECFVLLMGLDFQKIGCLFSFKERLNQMEEKLKIEGLLK